MNLMNHLCFGILHPATGMEWIGVMDGAGWMDRCKHSKAKIDVWKYFWPSFTFAVENVSHFPLCDLPTQVMDPVF